MFRPVHVLIVAVLLLPACVSGAPGVSALTGDVELAKKVDSLLSGAVQDGFGGAVIVERNGRVLLSKGFGLANRQGRVPFTVDTIAPISSITKSFTALALVQLAYSCPISCGCRSRALSCISSATTVRNGFARFWERSSTSCKKLLAPGRD